MVRTLWLQNLLSRPPGDSTHLSVCLQGGVLIGAPVGLAPAMLRKEADATQRPSAITIEKGLPYRYVHQNQTFFSVSGMCLVPLCTLACMLHHSKEFHSWEQMEVLLAERN